MTTTAGYRERLLPTWWAWLLATGLVAMLAIAYGAALGATAGWAVAAGTGALAIALIWITAPQVRVEDDALLVDGARLPVDVIAETSVVSRSQIAGLRGPGADARLFVALRPWSTPNGVLVRLGDPADPHPAWLFSSRHPARVVDALAATMGHSRQALEDS